MQKIFNFKGVASRKEYWLMLVGLIGGYTFLISIIGLVSYFSVASGIAVLSVPLLILTSLLSVAGPAALAIAILALVIRRVRDVKISKWLALAALIILPLLSLSLMAALPEEIRTTLGDLGRKNVMLASSLILLSTFGLPFVLLGTLPSRNGKSV